MPEPAVYGCGMNQESYLRALKVFWPRSFEEIQSCLHFTAQLRVPSDVLTQQDVPELHGKLLEPLVEVILI